MPVVTRRQLSAAIAQLMPRIIQGVHLDFFVKRGVTQTQFLVLMAVHASGRCTMGTLARNLHVSLPTSSGIVDRLVRAGFVKRLPGSTDRRQVVVELTAKGHAFIRQFQVVIRQRWEEVLRALKPQALAAFYHVVTTLREQLQAGRECC